MTNNITTPEQMGGAMPKEQEKKKDSNINPMEEFAEYSRKLLALISDTVNLADYKSRAKGETKTVSMKAEEFAWIDLAREEFKNFLITAEKDLKRAVNRASMLLQEGQRMFFEEAKRSGTKKAREKVVSMLDSLS